MEELTAIQYSGRLNLEIPRLVDFTRYYEIYADPQTNLFNPSGPMNLEKAENSFAAIQVHWSTHHFGIWAIRHRGSNDVIGFGGLSYLLYGNELKLNLGYRFDKNVWGNGYATELAAFSITYGFTELNADKIYALVRPNHHASIHVLEKCNMKVFGRLNDVPGHESSLVYAISK